MFFYFSSPKLAILVIAISAANVTSKNEKIMSINTTKKIKSVKISI
jgi:hypothetical protein